MERPTLPRATVGMALIAVGASGYLTKGLPDWLWASRPMATASAAATVTYALHQDKQVRVELPSGWRWLAQKPDGSEVEAAYFPMTRFQGQNVLKDPVSVRVDGIPNGKGLTAAAMLEAMTKGIEAKPGSLATLDHLPPGMAGMTYQSQQGKRTQANYVFVKPGSHITYVLAIASSDERFTAPMADHIARSFQVSL